MFDLSWGEIAVIGAVALIVIGPKELPGVLRGMGQAVAKLRRMASDFQYQFNQALQEAEVDKVKSTIADVNQAVQSATPNFNPIDYAREQIKSAVDEVKSSATPAAVGVAAGTIAATSEAAATPGSPEFVGPVGPAARDPLLDAIPAPAPYAPEPIGPAALEVGAPLSITPPAPEAAAPAPAAPQPAKGAA